MDRDETILVSGRIVAEFDEVASHFLAGAAEYIRPPEMPQSPPVSTQ